MTGVSTFEELDAWKLSVDLRNDIYRMTSVGKAARDFKFRDQVRDSSASASRNIAAGWGRFHPNENAPYVRWARASLVETQNHLLHGQKEAYFTPQDFAAAWRLSSRAIGATTRYLRYLESCNGEIPEQPPRKSKRTVNREPRTQNPEP